MQAEIARNVSEELRLRLTGGQEQQLEKQPTQNPQGYQLYLNGLYVSPAELAVLYVGLGDKEAALDVLERAYREHDVQMQYLKVDPDYDALRPEARFQDIMRKVGLPQ